MTFCWWADDCPLIVVLGSSLPSSTTKKRCQSWTPSDKTFWIRACNHIMHLNCHNLIDGENTFGGSDVSENCWRSHKALTTATIIYRITVTFSKWSFEQSVWSPEGGQVIELYLIQILKLSDLNISYDDWHTRFANWIMIINLGQLPFIVVFSILNH